MTDNNLDTSYQITRQKLIFIGDVSVGKTSIINSLLNQSFSEEYEASIGVDFFSKTLKFKSRSIKLQIWDSAGQEKFKSLIPNYIRGSSLIFLVYDVTNKKSFDNLKNWIEFILNIEICTIVIVGNKIDLSEKREITTEEAEKFCEEEKYDYFEVSAKTGKNIDFMLYNSVSQLNFFNQILGNDFMDKEDIVKQLMEENNRNNNEGNISNEMGIFSNNQNKDLNIITGNRAEKETIPNKSFSDMNENIINGKKKKKDVVRLLFNFYFIIYYIIFYLSFIYISKLKKFLIYFFYYFLLLLLLFSILLLLLFSFLFIKAGFFVAL